MPRYRTWSRASPSPSSGTSRTVDSKHASDTAPVGRRASTIWWLRRAFMRLRPSALDHPCDARTTTGPPDLRLATGPWTVLRSLGVMPELPVEVDDLTAAWMSDAMDTDVTSVTVLDRHSG